MQIIVQTALGVLLALVLRWLFWLAIGSTYKWLGESYGVCIHCGERDSKYRFSYKNESHIVCVDCARESLGDNFHEAIRRGNLRSRKDDG